MPIAITEDHQALGQTASDFLAKHDSRGAARVLLESETETLPPFWGDIADLGTGFGQQDRALIGRGGPSIDHSVWFQEDIRADEWVLVDLVPVKARSARGCYHGSLRDRDGLLGATIYQEQLLLPGSAADMRAAAVPSDEDQPVDRAPEDAAARRGAHGEHPAGG